MNSQSKPWQDLEDDILVEEFTGDISEIVVYNDDVNTFDWVIESFMEVCKHSFEQAEQLSMMVHFRGKASVKRGIFDILRPMKDALCERGLSAVIETIKV
ncbi:MAG: ATP-dependent Clp protease adaptor ClpS [Saprospiraceae bacterium]|nr:ATP-dependent Clp protease adaptor ClpS [Saprospiraceae bacterium]MBK7810267.1 ATP-dependent Clp protease adaptor ClpS [Saprospiraceae bacterium]MBK9629870.1 ATP-dependent Clp protease adaptor ClpS [Saprospiraceae bacterium]